MGRGGGGGGLRILPHKSWNVYGYEQQLKVRADEAKFAAEVERVEALKRKNEAEYRLQVMRQRAVRGGEGEGEGHEGDADYNQGEESGVEQTTQDHSQADRDDMPQLERDPYSRTIADIQSAVTAPAAASSSSRSSIRRYVIEEEDRNERMPEDASASTVDASGSTLPATSMSFLGDIGLSAKASEIARLKASNTRASELAAQRRYAPVSCFVESFRDENDPTTFGALRPWYTRTSEAAEKMLQQQQKQHQQLQHKAASTNNANSGRRRRRQPLDTIGQHESQDPLVEMKQHLRELKAYERSATDHATSTNSSFPSSFASASAPPSFAPSNPSHMRASRWDNIIPADASMVQPSFTRTPREVKEPVDVDRKSDAKRSRSRSCSRKDRKKSKKRTRKRSRSSSASSSSSSSSSSSVSSSSSSSSDSDSDSDSDHRSRRRRHRHRSKKSKKEKKKKKRRHDSPSKQKHHRSHHTSAYHAAPLPVSSHPIQVSSHVDSSASGVVPSSSSSSVDLLSSLRAGRLARERQEREKVAALLNVPAWATFEQHLMHKR